MKVTMIEKISQARIPVDALVEISWTFLFFGLIVLDLKFSFSEVST